MSFNTRSPAVKRLMKEAQELKDPTELYAAQPLDDNIFEWHFTIRGPSDTDFDGGIYHGRILLPAEYPMKPPSITFLTPNGRFRTNEKICLSISGHHPETWLPSWSIRTALLALIGFMPTSGDGALGSLDYTSEERKILAKKSVTYKCSTCNIENSYVLLELTDKSQKIVQEAKELASQIDFKNKKETNNEYKKPEESSVSNNEISSSFSSTIGTTTTTTTTTSTTTATSSTTIIRNDINNPPINSFSRSSSTPVRQQQSPSTSNSSIFIFILCAMFLFLLFRRLYIIFSDSKTDFSSMFNEDL